MEIHQKHELEDQYDEAIKNWFRPFIASLIVLLISSIVYSITLVSINQYAQARKRSILPGLTPSSIQTAEFINLLSVYVMIGGAVFVVFTGRELYLIEREKQLALQHSPEVIERIKKTHQQVSQYLLFPDSEFNSYVLKKMLRIYSELDVLSTEALAERRDRAGITNVHNKWYGIGKTLEEGLINTLYVSRMAAGEAKIQAAEDALKSNAVHIMTATSLNSRSALESQKETTTKLLEKYLEGSSGSHIEAQEKLSNLCGEYLLVRKERKVVSITLRLDEEGEFAVYRRDGKSRYRLSNITGGQEIRFELSPPAEGGRIEIVRERDEEMEPINLA